MGVPYILVVCRVIRIAFLILFSLLYSAFGVWVFLQETFSHVWYDFQVDNIYYKRIGRGRVEVTNRDGKSNSYSGHVSIPPYVRFGDKGYRVVRIGRRAFTGCQQLASIYIPCTIHHISEFAFNGCANLRQLQLPHELYTIGNAAFAGCGKLTALHIPKKVHFIGKGAFDRCESVEQIQVDAKNQLFDSREGSNAIIQTTGNVLIKGCKKTVIPSSVQRIGIGAFDHCTSYSWVRLPKNLHNIDSNAFAGCADLEAISIPEGVRTIGKGAFSNCHRLQKIDCYIPEPVNIDYYTFRNQPSTCILIVNPGTKEQWEKAPGWNRLTIRERGKLIVDS